MDGQSNRDLSRRDALRVLGERAAVVALGAHAISGSSTTGSRQGGGSAFLIGAGEGHLGGGLSDPLGPV